MSVLADGCFDPIHIGHVRYLAAASQIAKASGPLFVRVAPDAAILAKRRAVFQSQEERAACIVALHPVGTLTPLYTLSQETLALSVLVMKPTYLVKGIDWYGSLPGDVLAACAKVGTHIVFVNTQEQTSAERLQG